MPYTEANYENAVIEIFRDTLRYDYIYAPDLVRDYADPLYSDELILALHRVNPTLSDAAITEAVYKLRNFESGSTLHKNIQFMDYLQNGVSVATMTTRSSVHRWSGSSIMKKWSATRSSLPTSGQSLRTAKNAQMCWYSLTVCPL